MIVFLNDSSGDGTCEREFEIRALLVGLKCPKTVAQEARVQSGSVEWRSKMKFKTIAESNLRYESSRAEVRVARQPW
jgi:hypothetical protein